MELCPNHVTTSVRDHRRETDGVVLTAVPRLCDRLLAVLRRRIVRMHEVDVFAVDAFDNGMVVLDIDRVPSHMRNLADAVGETDDATLDETQTFGGVAFAFFAFGHKHLHTETDAQKRRVFGGVYESVAYLRRSLHTFLESADARKDERLRVVYLSGFVGNLDGGTRAFETACDAPEVSETVVDDTYFHAGYAVRASKRVTLSGCDGVARWWGKGIEYKRVERVLTPTKEP